MCKLFWDERSSTYNQDFASSNVRYMAFDWIIDQIPHEPHQNIIDVGCGTGLLAHRIKNIDKRYKITLVDQSIGMLNESRTLLSKFSNIKFIKANFENLSEIASNSIDIYITSFALHHIQDDLKKKALDEAYRVLSSTGTILIVDEIICDASIEACPEKLFLIMLSIFYPNESVLKMRKRFRSFKEYPTSLEKMGSLLNNSGFETDFIIINPIVAFIKGKKKSYVN